MLFEIAYGKSFSESFKVKQVSSACQCQWTNKPTSIFLQNIYNFVWRYWEGHTQLKVSLYNDVHVKRRTKVWCEEKERVRDLTDLRKGPTIWVGHGIGKLVGARNLCILLKHCRNYIPSKYRCSEVLFSKSYPFIFTFNLNGKFPKLSFASNVPKCTGLSFMVMPKWTVSF